MRILNSTRARFSELRRLSKRESGFGGSELLSAIGVIILVLVIPGWIVFSGRIAKAEEAKAKAAADMAELERAMARELGGEVATAAPSPSPSTQLASAAPSADYSFIWVALGIIGALVLIAGLTAFLILQLRRLTASKLELQERRNAKAEDHRRALEIWQGYRNVHDGLKLAVLDAETDWDLIFQYPALVDGSVPQTRDFHRALQEANAQSATPPAELNLSMAIGELPYPRLVGVADEAWASAWKFARRTGTRLIPREERKRIDQIVKLLRMARSTGGSEQERAIAYERAAKLVSELRFVKVPEATLQALGAESRLMLEGSQAPSNSERVQQPAFAL